MESPLLAQWVTFSPMFNIKSRSGTARLGGYITGGGGGEG